MYREHDHKDEQGSHDPFCYIFYTFLHTEEADEESYYTYEDHPECHLSGIAEHPAEHFSDKVRSLMNKVTFAAPVCVIEHPSGYCGVVEHEEIAAEHTDPFGVVPACSLWLELLKAVRNTLLTPAAHCELSCHYRDT